MLAGRVVAAADTATDLTESQVDPIPFSGGETVLAAVGGDGRRGEILRDV
jgi:hypothetical protein